METAEPRNILHVDMDAFFAAVEQLDHPELRGKPVLVGGDPGARGVVSTASYEARPFGCRSAMPMAQALRLCPRAIVVRPNFERYTEVSRQIREVFEQFTPLVEPLSIDEAFLDLTGTERLFGPAIEAARAIKRRIFETTRLTASVGVAPNKFLAKLASDLEKPDGLVVVPRDAVQDFLDPLPVSRLWGAGKVTLQKLDEIRVRTFGDLRRLNEDELRRTFGDAGEHFYRLVRGIDDRPVVSDQQAKSISHEQTFATDLTDLEHLRSVLLRQTDDVARRLRRHGMLAKTVFVKIRRHDFRTFTRQTTLESPTDQTEIFWRTASGLFDEWASRGAPPVRLLGMGVTHFCDGEGLQMGLFNQEGEQRRRSLDRTVDEIRERFGRDAISRGLDAHRDEE